jgi:protease-4
VRYLEAQPNFRDQLVEALADRNDDDSAVPTDAFSMLARQPEQQLASVIAEIRSIMSGPSIQARCLECPAVAPARIEQKDLTLLGLIRSWLG